MHAAGILLAILFFDRLPNGLRWPVRIYCLLALVWIVFLALRALVGAWRKDRRRLAFGIAGFAMVYLAFEGLCLLFNGIAAGSDAGYREGRPLELSGKHRRILERWLAGESTFYAFSATTGWTLKPDGNFHDTYLSNSQGLRADRDYPKQVPEGVSRIICTGDSFTFGAEVGNADAWPAILDRQAGEYEAVNFGVTGTCLTQSFLRYRERRDEFDHQVVIIGFMSNNIRRTVNVYRPFLRPQSGFPFVKPFSRLDGDGRLEIVDCPFQSLEEYRSLLERPSEALADLAGMEHGLGQRTAGGGAFPPSARTWRIASARLPLESNFRQLVLGSTELGQHNIDAYRENSYELNTASQLFDRYVSLVEGEGRRAVIVLFPNPGDVETFNRKRLPEYLTLVRRLRESGHECIDFLDDLKKKYGKRIPVDRVFLKDHYSAETNADVADRVRRALSRRD